MPQTTRSRTRIGATPRWSDASQFDSYELELQCASSVFGKIVEKSFVIITVCFLNEGFLTSAILEFNDFHLEKKQAQLDLH